MPEVRGADGAWHARETICEDGSRRGGGLWLTLGFKSTCDRDWRCSAMILRDFGGRTCPESMRRLIRPGLARLRFWGCPTSDQYRVDQFRASVRIWIAFWLFEHLELPSFEIDGRNSNIPDLQFLYTHEKSKTP
jgi:hypothetical protein